MGDITAILKVLLYNASTRRTIYYHIELQREKRFQGRLIEVIHHFKMKKVDQTKIKAKYFMCLYWNLITICFAENICGLGI